MAVLQFYLGVCSKSGTLAAWLASCQCLGISSSANDNRIMSTYSGLNTIWCQLDLGGRADMEHG